jgi:cell division protease FtsH
MSEEDITAPTTPEASMPFPGVRPTASSQQPPSSDPAPAGAMGPLELAAYRADWRASSRYRRHVAEVAAAREHELLVKRLEEEALIAAEKAMHAAGKKSGGGLGGLRKPAGLSARKQEQNEDDEDAEKFSLVVRRRPPPPSHPVTAARVAARLMFARLFDSRPGLHEAIRSSAPIVAVDVPDPEMLERVLATWQDTLFTDTSRVMKVGNSSTGKREDYDAVYVAVKELPKAKDRSEREKDALAALSLALPLIAISPASESHLPVAVLKAAPVRIGLPRLDPVTIARAIRIVTGRPCRDLLDEATAARIAPVDLIVAIRFDRRPVECLAELRRLAADKAVHKGGRDISLDELHGMDDAVAWARSTIRDLEAWRRGEIAWSALDPGACLVGPPGTGKTLFAECFSRAAKLPMLACSLAQWQGTDEGHLGHLLRAMKRDFDTARAQAPCIMFIDEIDSFADRSKLRHAYADYVVEVVNGFISQLDGVAGREGLIFLAASNDVSRCDPAILRSGRLNRIIRIGLPNAEELERMFRVRLAGQLSDEDLGEICLLALGSTGADVERITKDAVRFARHENRPLELADLRSALVDIEDRDPAALRRAAVHEAGHLLMELLLFGGATDVHATIARSGNTGGATVRTKPPLLAGTYSDYHARLQVLLAGRTAEEIAIGEASHGASGRRGSDLQQAAAIAAAMVASLGLAGPNRLLFLAPHENTDELLSYADVRTTAHAELVKAEEACRSTLISHRAALDEIAATLLRAGRVDGVTAAAIVGAHRETKERE